MISKKLCILFCFTFILSGNLVFSEGWSTWYEQYNHNRTPDYAETVSFSQRLSEASPILHYTTFGKTPRQYDLPLLILDAGGNFTPQQVHESGNLVLMIMACIHPGEPVGKDAGLTFLRDIVIHGKHTDLLDKITVLFIPIFNVDGHERFGPYNRINQNGPEETGWRTNALNLNLNRDFLKTDSREMEHLVQLWDQWQPDFFIDTHSTNGGDYQYTMTYILETFGNMDEDLTEWCEGVFLPFWKSAMQEAGYPVFPYVTYRQWHDPRSGLYSRASPPALSNGYAAARNRPGLLLETHMMKPYKMRVESTYLTFLHTMQLLDREHSRLRKLNQHADTRTASAKFRQKPFPLDFSVSSDSVMVEFLGVEYSKKTSTLTGGQWFKYDSNKPVTYTIPYFKQQEVTHWVMLPDAYIIPAEWERVIRVLGLHGVDMQITENPITIEIETYLFENVVLSSNANEGRQTASFSYEPINESRTFAAGSAIIPMDQPLARLIAHALEPDAPSSLTYWGEFNSIFQRTEYFESYVMEEMAREMIRENPELQLRLNEKLAADSGFASSPREILNWFYEQTPYVDHRHNIYPVGRIWNN